MFHRPIVRAYMLGTALCIATHVSSFWLHILQTWNRLIPIAWSVQVQQFVRQIETAFLMYARIAKRTGLGGHFLKTIDATFGN
ncbi:hypothetical protein B1F75_20005 [Pseudomonas syringae]|nr:hypothetical protein B1F71_25710 [Pseudomonas syringae]RXT90980.1 hypothetical protein B1F75_20005 [Pseudomonas syringae]